MREFLDGEWPHGADFTDIAQALDRTLVVSGIVPTIGAGLQSSMTAGQVLLDGNFYPVAAANLTHDAEASLAIRYDLVVVNTSGVLAIIKGTVDTKAPAIPTGNCLIAVVQIDNGSIVPDAVKDARAILPSIELSVKKVYDYSEDLSNKVTPLYQWGSPSKLPNVGTGGRGVAWSPNGEMIAVAGLFGPTHNEVYKRSGTGFSQITGIPAVLASGRDVAWSPNGEFLAVAYTTASPYITIYQRSGTTFTQLPNPASLPTGAATGVSWSPNGELLAISHTTSPYITIYQRSGTTFTKLADPASLPSGNAEDIAWSPNGEYVAVAIDTSPYIEVYQYDGGTTFTKLAALTAAVGAGDGVDWSPDGEFLALAHTTSAGITVYQRSGTTFTKLTTPATASDGNNVDWHPSGEYVAIANKFSPGVQILQRTGTTFTILAALPTPPSNGNDVDWSPDGEFLAVTSGGINIYQTGEDMPDQGVLFIRGSKREGT